MSRKRTHYAPGFKKKAVELSLARQEVRPVAEELGIKADLLYRWRREYESYQHNSFPGNGNPKQTDEQKEIARLKAELADAELERDILKKAISIFSKSDRKNTNL